MKSALISGFSELGEPGDQANTMSGLGVTPEDSEPSTEVWTSL